MPRNSLSRIALAVVLAACATPASALTPAGDSRDPGDLLPAATRLASPAAALQLDHSPAWQSFRARYGSWTALWNAGTGTPHRAFGRGIALPGFADRAGAVDAALRAFVTGHPATFGTPDGLRTAALTRAGGRWYARYQQTFRGVPVLFTDWEFRVGAKGSLFAFGADALAIPPDTRTTPRIPAVVAREAAIAGLPFDRARDEVRDGEGTFLLPLAGEAGTTIQLVYDVRVRIADPPGNWVVLVDAGNGDVLWRMNRVRTAIGGTATGEIHPLLPTDPLAPFPFAHMTVTDGTLSTSTDLAGAWSLASAGAVTISASLAGPYVNVNRQDGADAAFAAGASDPATVNIVWNAGNSQDSERDGFYHANVAHHYVKSLDPPFTGVDYAMPCAVNIASTCNAFWDGTGINFYAAGGGCPNTATLADVVYHEYGHGVNDQLYIQQGSLFGMQSGTLHEGLADVNAAFIRDDPVIGNGFFGPGTMIRTIDNTRAYPQDLSGDGHISGLIVAGAMWDLRQAIGLADAEHLAHFAKYGVPDDPDPGIAMNEYFLEVLMADDDDADLANGTPHSADIIAAFNAHGIGTGFFIDIGHTPLADQPTSAPVPVTATIAYTGPFGALDPGAATLHYQVNGGAVQSAPMTPTGIPDEFGAAIPGQAAAIVRYWIEAGDANGGTRLDPPTAPAAAHVFIAGATTTLLDEDMESDPGWTVGGPLDDATTGIWLRADPVGTIAQPEDDHTAAGTLCWVTGNATPGAGAGINDVDNGRTTLTSASFDATAGGNQKPVIDYWKWYSNDQGGAPGSDVWRVELSNDGGTTWAVVESTQVSTAGWERVTFFIDDVAAPSADMRLRFVASDEGDGSLVEAAVDDVRVLDFTAVLAAGRPGPAPLALSAPAPNPFGLATRFQLALPVAARAAVRVYDVHGRLLRTLADGVFAAGRHDLEWDGRDAAGRDAPAGVFFVRLDSALGGAVRRVARVR